MKLVKCALVLSLFGAVPAWGNSGASITGRYADIDGALIDIVHSGGVVTLKPEASGRNMPEQVRAFLGDLALKGPIVIEASGDFQIDADFSKVITPTPTTKIDIKISLDAVGRPTDEGLHMKSCQWNVKLHVFAEGEIAASENRSQACVGMWKKK